MRFSRFAKDLATSFTVSRAAFEANFPRLIGRDDVACLVVEDKEVVLGYCLAFDHPTFDVERSLSHTSRKSPYTSTIGARAWGGC